MSLQIAANHLASKGRGPDTMLVHMAPSEVKSLQSIAMAHGGSLTINPQTGLPEAGFLSSLLPMIAGAALTATGVGAPMAALMVGGGTGLATGNLKKGLMAGLGAFGGANLGQGLAALGTQELATQAALATPADAAAGQIGANAAEAVKAAQANPFSTIGKGFQTMFGGGQTAAGASGFGAGIDALGGLKGVLQTGGSLVSPMLMGGEEKSAMPTAKATTPYPAQQFDPGLVSPAPQADVPAYANMGQNFSSEQKYFNPSFIPASVSPFAQTTTQMPFMAAVGGPVEDMSMRNDAQMAMTNGPEMYAAGGISSLGDYSDGGRLLRGPGDGVSDSIPASIGNKRPARLADGEFVVPARIVSELGNGSTEAGARKLYAMMDRVQQNRRKTVGKGKVAVNSRSEKLLPA
jgi:hypothetical protein